LPAPREPLSFPYLVVLITAAYFVIGAPVRVFANSVLQQVPLLPQSRLGLSMAAAPLVFFATMLTASLAHRAIVAWCVWRSIHQDHPPDRES
jgi:hypothetical protein